jgi:hypothetical protein
MLGLTVFSEISFSDSRGLNYRRIQNKICYLLGEGSEKIWKFPPFFVGTR